MELADTLGPMVLAGSGEYTNTMEIVDRYLIETAGGRTVVLIATSCAQEGQDVMTKWEQMGVAHFKRLGVDAKPLRICDTEDANKPENAELIAEAGLVWFSGGSPVYLAQSFEDTLAFQALEAANRRGTAVAGSSGGLGVLNAHIPLPPGPVAGLPSASTWTANPNGSTGLGLAAHVRAMAHFDRAEVRRPEMIERTVSSLQPGQKAVGVDEDTAIVWHQGVWRVMGHKRAVVYESDMTRTIFHHGERIDILPPPVRAQAPSVE
jgi:cyanophycinase